MKQIRLQMISPHDFEVIRVISFSDSHLNKNGVIVYRRPLTLNYNKDVLDDFDESFIKWLKQLNFQNVTLWHSEDIISFHSHDDLEQLIQKRGRADITKLTIDDEITNRPYQKTAIKSLVEWLNGKHRRGLLVLATGTGKTRVSISLCKLLDNNNWIKRVLFLADRTELVKQAHKNFENSYLARP